MLNTFEVVCAQGMHGGFYAFARVDLEFECCEGVSFRQELTLLRPRNMLDSQVCKEALRSDLQLWLLGEELCASGIGFGDAARHAEKAE